MWCVGVEVVRRSGRECVVVRGSSGLEGVGEGGSRGERKQQPHTYRFLCHNILTHYRYHLSQ